MLTTKRNFSIGKEGKKKSYEGTERTRADFYFKNQSRKICDWGKKKPSPRPPELSHPKKKKHHRAKQGKEGKKRRRKRERNPNRR